MCYLKHKLLLQPPLLGSFVPEIVPGLENFSSYKVQEEVYLRDKHLAASPSSAEAS